MQPLPPHPYPLRPLSAWGILGRSLEIFIDNSLLLLGIAFTYTVPHAFLSLLGRWISKPEEFEQNEIIRIAWSPDQARDKLELLRQALEGSPWIGLPQSCLEWIWQPIMLGAVFIALDREIRGKPCTVGEAIAGTSGRRQALFLTNLLVLLLIYAAGIAGFIAAVIMGVIAAVATGISLDSLAEMFLTALVLIPILLMVCLTPPVIVFLRTVFSICSAAIEGRDATDAIGRSWQLFKKPVGKGFLESHDWRMTVTLTVAGLFAMFSGLAAAVPRAVDLLLRGGALVNDALNGLGLSPLPPVHLPPWSPYMFFVIESVFSAFALLSIAVPVFVYFTDFRIRLEGFPDMHPEPASIKSEFPDRPATMRKNYLD